MSRILAIDADALGLYVASGTVRKGVASIDRAIAIPDELPLLTVDTAPSLGAKLKDLLKQAGIAPAPAIVLLGRDKIFLKEVRHPAISGSEEPAIIKFQAVKELNENAEDMILDYLPLGPTADGGRKSMAIFIKKDYLKAAKELCEAAGIKIVALTPRPYAAAKALQAAIAAGAEPPESSHEPVALLYPTGSSAEFCVVRDGEVLFSRPVPASALQSEASFVGEIRRNLAVVNGQFSGAINSLYLAEADAPGGGWAGRLKSALSVSVRTFDPLAGSPAEATIPPQYRGRFTAATGGVYLKTVDGPLPINFVTPRQPKDEPNKNRTKFLAAALAVCLIIGLGFAGGMWMLSGLDNDLQALNEEKTKVEGLLNNYTLNAKRTAAADEFMKHQVRMHDELYDWTDLFPDIKDTRVTAIDFTSTPLPDKKTRMDEEKKKETVVGYKPPPIKPVGTVTFTIQAKDRATVAAFVKALSAQSDVYEGVLAPAANNVTTAGTNVQTFTVKAQVKYRSADAYLRKMNIALPKVKDQGANEFDGGGDFSGISAPIAGGEAQ